MRRVFFLLVLVLSILSMANKKENGLLEGWATGENFFNTKEDFEWGIGSEYQQKQQIKNIEGIDSELISFYEKNKEYNCTLDIPEENLKKKSILTQYGVFTGTVKVVPFSPMSEVPYGEWSIGNSTYECYLDNKYILIKEKEGYMRYIDNDGNFYKSVGEDGAIYLTIDKTIKNINYSGNYKIKNEEITIEATRNVSLLEERKPVLNTLTNRRYTIFDY